MKALEEPVMPNPSAVTTLQQKVHELADRLPENATWRDVAYQAAVRAEAEEGRADIAAGRVVDGDEMLRWIDSWGTEHELEAPQLPQ
jgi:predicted transcriptional regulator